MSGDDKLERRLEAWLEATARPMPRELLEDIVATVPHVPRGGVRAVLPSGRRWQAAIAAVAAVLVVAVGLGVALRVPTEPGASATPAASTSLEPTASLSPEPSASPSPEPSPSAVAAGLAEWHRNNYNAGEERLTCREGIDSWTCTYEVPDGTGSFVGQNVTDSWTCPAWFPSAICENATSVYRGVFVCCLPTQEQPSAVGTPTTVSQELVITEVGGQPVLQLYWVGQFVCPWYRTFDEALAHDFNCIPAL